MITKLDFEEEGLMDSLMADKPWRDYIKPSNLFDTPAKCAAVAVGTILTFIIIAALFATDTTSSALRMFQNDGPDWSQMDTLFALEIHTHLTLNQNDMKTRHGSVRSWVKEGDIGREDTKQDGTRAE